MSNDKKKESNLFEEIKKLDEKKEKLCKSIAEINAFSIELKDKLKEEDIDLQTKTYQILIEKEKLKNENQINILAEDNEKLEKYLTLLAKQYELEIKYIEQYLSRIFAFVAFLFFFLLAFSLQCLPIRRDEIFLYPFDIPWSCLTKNMPDALFREGQSGPQTPQTFFDADFEGLTSNAELYIFNQEDSQE